MSLEIENIDDFEPEKTQSIELEEYGVWVKKETPEFADTSLIDNDIFDSNIFLDNPEEKITSSDEETSKEEKIEEIIIDETSRNFEPKDETNEIFDSESISQETTNLSENEIENISTTENQSSNSFDIPDFENLENIDLSDFMSDFDATPKSNSTEEKVGSSSTSEEINLDDFGVDFSNSEFVSLDDFITPTEEKNDIIGDEPLDIELTFDDTYMSTTGANPLDEMETDIPEGFLPSNDDILDNFDDIFENVTDISEPEPSPEPIVTESVSFDEVSEFDDLLFALEDTPQSTETIVSKEKVIETSQYDITVNLDEDEIETTSTPQIEDDEEDFNISLYSDDKINEDDSSKTQNQENTLEVFPMINDNNAFFSIDDLDDSISFIDETPVENNSTSEDFAQENTDFPIENTFLDENIENFSDPSVGNSITEESEEAFGFEEPILDAEDFPTFEDNSFLETTDMVAESFTEPIFEEPMAEEPVAETTEDTFAFESDTIVEEPVAESTEDAFTFEEPIPEEPVAETTEDAFAFEEPMAEEPVAESTEDAFAFEEPMTEEPLAETTEDAFAFESDTIPEEPVAESTEDAFAFEEPFTEEPVAETTEDAFAFESDTIPEEPVAESTEDAFAFEEPMAEEPVAESTEDTFAFEEPIAEEPVAESTEDTFAFEEPMAEEPVAETTEDAFAFEEPMAEEPVAESTEDAFAFEEPMAEEPVAESTEDVFAFEEPIAEEPVAETTEEDEDPFAIDVEQELNESFLEQDAIPENEDINFQDSLPTVASITAAATMGTMAFSSSNEVIENEPQHIENPEKAEDKSMNSMSNSLLEKIVNELTELRAEMASIKEELNTIKTSPEDSIEDEIEIVEDKEVSTGFFSDEEDDDTIALSGDELNNILNCADFTEETQEEVSDDFSNEVSDDISINEENYTNDGALIIEESSIENQDNESETEIVIDEEIAEEQNDDSVEKNTTSREEFNTDIEASTLVDEKVQIELNEDDEDEIQPDEILDDSNDSFYEGEIDLPVLDISGETIRDPELVKINFELDEQENEVPDELPDELAIPQLDDDFVVDSSSTDLLEEAIIETKPADLDEINDEIMAALDEEDEIDDAPTTEVFNSQWNSFESSNNGDNPITITAEEIDFARRKAESETENPQPVENSIQVDLKKDVKSVLEYMDKLLANLPDEKIDEFAKSEHFEVYKKLFTELGLA